MVKKYLIIGDVHFSQYSSLFRKRGKRFSLRLENMIECLNWLQKFSIQNGIDNEIFLGDFFDSSTLNCEEITALQEIKWNDTPKTFVVGNHESNMLTLDFSSTKIFESLHGRVVDSVLNEKINDDVNFTYIPYITTGESLKVSNYITPAKKNVVFAHEDLAGLQYGKYTSKSGFDVEDINNSCSLFIDGHLHNSFPVGGKIVIAGNFTGQNLNEDATIYNHSVYILTVDGENLTLENYPVPCAANFYKIYVNKNEDLKQLDNLKNNSIVSLRCSNKMADKAIKKIEKLPNVTDFRTTITYYSKTNDEDSIDFVTKDWNELFCELARKTFEPSDILEDELSRLMGGK